MQYMQVALTRK